MRWLILDADGMAGHVVCLYLRERGHDVSGIDIYDALDEDRLRAILIGGRFDAVVNCAAVVNEWAETDKPQAVLLNAWLPNFLADITSDTDIKVIHRSTDCVFSGKRGYYTESDVPDGISFYARTKALGELDDGKNLTIRTSLVGPDTSPQSDGLLGWFIRQEYEVKGFTKVIWTGLTTLEFAKAVEAAGIERAYGLCNLVPPSSISKYDLLKLFNHYFRADTVDISPFDGYVNNKSLVRTNFDFSYIPQDYELMIAELAAWTRAHKELYPHYHL